MESELSDHILRLSSDGENGRVVIADKDFMIGNVVLSEMPLFTWNNESLEDFIVEYLMSSPTVKEAVMEMDYHSSDWDEKDRFFDLRQASIFLSNKMSEIYHECSHDLVYKLLQIKRINAHSFRTAELPSGGAFFRIASKCNHTCSPNVMYSALEQSMRFTAIDHIAMGNQINPTYITDLLVTPYQQRQSKLLETKDFQCQCRRCLASDDCRGVRCLTSTTTRAQQSGKTLCTGIAYRRNSDGVWMCGMCGAISDDSAMSMALHAESNLEDRYAVLQSKVDNTDATLVPADFTDLVKAVCRVGFSRSHHLAVKVSRLYVKWCAGQSTVMVEGGLHPDAQAMSPWGEVCSPISFLTTAVQEGIGVIRQLQCVGVCCARSKCIELHRPVHDCCMDVFWCLKNSEQLIRYSRNVDLDGKSLKSKSVVAGMGGVLPAGLLSEVVAVGRRYLPLLFAQFGRDDADIIAIRDRFLAVPSCSNPNCFETSVAVAETALPVLKACSKCHAAAYCCRECQVAHFKNGHKAACKAMTESPSNK